MQCPPPAPDGPSVRLQAAEGAYALENAASLAATAALVSWASAACINKAKVAKEMSFIMVSLPGEWCWSAAAGRDRRREKSWGLPDLLLLGSGVRVRKVASD